jgi:uncharacterized membrane protein YvbJ
MLRWQNLKKEAKIILAAIIFLAVFVLIFAISFVVINWRSSEKFQTTTSSTTISINKNYHKKIKNLIGQNILMTYI